MIWYALATLNEAQRDFYSVLYAMYRDGMLRYARSIVEDEELAADVVQLAFVNVMGKAKVLQGLSDYKVRAYIAVTTRNAALGMLRKQREFPAVIRGGTGESQTGYIDSYTSLPDISRDAVILKHVYGLKYCEIGRVLGISEDAAKKRVRRGLDALGADLKRGIADAIV